MKLLFFVLLSIIAISYQQVLCTPCQVGVDLVKDYLSKPDDELLQMLLRACEQLPEQPQNLCKLAVTIVGKQMITYIRNNLREPSRSICVRFRLCSPQEEKQEVEVNGPLCTPCQIGVDLVKDYLSKPDDELLQMLLKGCEQLPEQPQNLCKLAVTIVGKQMITYIRNNLREPSRSICARFRLCSPQEKKILIKTQ